MSTHPSGPERPPGAQQFIEGSHWPSMFGPQVEIPQMRVSLQFGPPSVASTRIVLPGKNESGFLIDSSVAASGVPPRGEICVVAMKRLVVSPSLPV